MVGLGVLFILFFVFTLYASFKRDVSSMPWLLKASIVMLPLGYVASEAGWIVAEMGRQPWAIQDMLPTWMATSGITPTPVIITFFIFLVLFTVLFCVEVNIMYKTIKKYQATYHSETSALEV